MADAFRRVHRVLAVLFLLTLPVVIWASATGDPKDPSPLVYLSVPPMLVLTVTGTWLLVRPWLAKRRAQRTD